jgi:diguanylate cyclase (GGDEF)-like protein
MEFSREAAPPSRAELVRALTAALSDEHEYHRLWERCAPLLMEIAGADALSVAVRDLGVDRIEYHTSGASASIDALAVGALFADETLTGEHERALAIRFGGTALAGIAFSGLHAFDVDTAAMLDACAFSIGARIHHENALRDAERYAALALTDGLTGIPNRRRFDEVLHLEWQRAARERAPLTALVIDIDFFKAYNDRYGHDGGDLCLRLLATTLAATVQRPADLFARFGGEEFVALLPGSDIAGAYALAERMRAAVHELALPHERSALDRVTVSIGVASLVPEAGQRADVLFRAADDALYQAKRMGRDRVCARGYDGDPTRRGAVPTNLPVQSARLVGRRDEVAAIGALLAANRLVTVAAPGGTGKTRAALQAAQEALADTPDGVWFVDLSALRDPALMPTTIGELFDAHVPLGEGGVAHLIEAIGKRRALIVLDNCEHLLAGVAALAAALLSGCPNLRILATSREPLGVPHEVLYRLPLLSTDDAAALFIDRARAVRPDAAFDRDAEAIVAEICRRLDGIALAIELCASRMGVMSLADLASEVHERFRLLAAGELSALPRQQTMRATLDWSHDLLGADEAVVFRRVAIFAGSFTARAAAIVCADEHLQGPEIAAALAALVRKSLLLEDRSVGETRYHMLDTTLTYARERLAAASERPRLARRHAEWVLDLAVAADYSAKRVSTREWFAAQRPDLDNVRSALAWSFGSDGDAVLGATIAASLSALFGDAARLEGTEWYIRAIEALGDDPPPRIAAMLHSLLCISSARFTTPVMRRHGDAAVRYARLADDPLVLVRALNALAQMVGWYEPDEIAFADACAIEAIAHARVAGDPVDLAVALRTRGLTATDEATRRASLEESLELLRRHANSREIARGLNWLAELEFAAGNHTRAYLLGREARAAAEDSGARAILLATVINLGSYAIAAEEWDAAFAAGVEGMRNAREMREDAQLTNAVQVMAGIAAAAGDDTVAAELLGFCDARNGSLHSPRQAGQCDEVLYQRVSAALARQLGAQAYEAAHARGASLTEREAVAIAGAVPLPAQT